MTLEEKIGQMVHPAAGVERLGIPEYNWWNEGLHGVARAGVATVFPQAIGLAATWDTALMGRVAETISDEARAKHHEFVRRGVREIYTGLTFWSPNVNIFRDPRWGRGQETYGEDPYLTGRMGVAFVKGLQGDDPRYLKLVATPKHFAVHSGPEPDRHHFDARVSERDLRETYLPAFEACVKEGGAASVMGAYNRTNGEPCCGSPTLLERSCARNGASAAMWSRTAGRSTIFFRAWRRQNAGRGRGAGREHRLRSGVRLRVCSLDGGGRSGSDRRSDHRPFPGAAVHGADAPGAV